MEPAPWASCRFAVVAATRSRHSAIASVDNACATPATSSLARECARTVARPVRSRCTTRRGFPGVARVSTRTRTRGRSAASAPPCARSMHAPTPARRCASAATSSRSTSVTCADARRGSARARAARRSAPAVIAIPKGCVDAAAGCDESTEGRGAKTRTFVTRAGSNRSQSAAAAVSRGCATASRRARLCACAVV